MLSKDTKIIHRKLQSPRDMHKNTHFSTPIFLFPDFRRQHRDLSPNEYHLQRQKCSETPISPHRSTLPRGQIWIFKSHQQIRNHDTQISFAERKSLIPIERAFSDHEISLHKNYHFFQIVSVYTFQEVTRHIPSPYSPDDSPYPQYNHPHSKKRRSVFLPSLQHSLDLRKSSEILKTLQCHFLPEITKGFAPNTMDILHTLYPTTQT